MTRSRADYEGSLPSFELVEERIEYIGLTPKLEATRTWWTLRCPRAGCERPFSVLRGSWLRSAPDMHARPCPYCFKVGLIPALEKSTPAE